MKTLIHLLMLCALMRPSPAISETYQPQVVVTTSLLEAIVRGVGGEVVAVTSLCPAAMCPGHFELGTAAVKRIYDGDLIIMHGWERFLSNPGTEHNVPIQAIDDNRNGLVPEVHLDWIRVVSDMLIEVFPGHRERFQENAKCYREQVQTLSSECAIACAPLVDIPVIAHEKIAPLLDYFGMHVVGTFGRGDEEKPHRIQGIIDMAIKEHIRLIVENQQSGEELGATIAGEVPGLTVVTIANFPAAGTPHAYREVMQRNITLLREAVR